MVGGTRVALSYGYVMFVDQVQTRGGTARGGLTRILPFLIRRLLGRLLCAREGVPILPPVFGGVHLVESAAAPEAVGGPAISLRVSLGLLLVVCLIGLLVVAPTLLVVWRGHPMTALVPTLVFIARLLFLVLLADLVVLLYHVFLALPVSRCQGRSRPHPSTRFLDVPRVFL